MDENNAPKRQALSILENILARQESRLGPPRPGTTLHVIESACAYGPAAPLEGKLIVEEPDGTLRRIGGADLTVLIEQYPDFIKTWRLPNRD